MNIYMYTYVHRKPQYLYIFWSRQLSLKRHLHFPSLILIRFWHANNGVGQLAIKDSQQRK